MFLDSPAELAADLERAASAGISGQVHAIGDAAVRAVLDVFGTSRRGPLPVRIEHAQLVDPADVPRFAQLGVAASLQPVHLRSDATPAREAWGERAGNAFPVRALAESAALIPFGTDAPVESADPWPGIAVAVVRRDPDDVGVQPLGREHAIDLGRAIRAACVDPGLVARQPDVGRLVAGSVADLLIVRSAAFGDPFNAAAFAQTRPLATLIDGRVVHGDQAFDA